MTDKSSDLPHRKLTRRSNGRVIAGVAGGLADYFGIDPLLVRIGFAGMMVFGGAGLALYAIAWLLLPAAGHSAPIVEEALAWAGLTPRRMAWIAAIGVAVVIILSRPVYSPLWGGGWLVQDIDGPFLLAVAVIIVGILVLRGRDGTAAPAMTPAASTLPAPTLDPTVAAPLGAPLTAPTATRVKPAPRPRSPLFWYVTAAVLLGIGILALAANLASLTVTPGQYFGLVMALIGIGLLVGSWWGRARILILLGLLLAPLAVMASFVTAPLEGGLGDVRYAPTNAAELRTEYRLIGGRMVLDLSHLSVTVQPAIHIAASVALGQLTVILPSGASLDLQTRIGAGASRILDSSQRGTSLENRYVRRHAGVPTFVLDLQAGIGEIDVINDGGI